MKRPNCIKRNSHRLLTSSLQLLAISNLAEKMSRENMAAVSDRSYYHPGFHDLSRLDILHPHFDAASHHFLRGIHVRVDDALLVFFNDSPVRRCPPIPRVTCSRAGRQTFYC